MKREITSLLSFYLPTLNSNSPTPAVKPSNLPPQTLEDELTDLRSGAGSGSGSGSSSSSNGNPRNRNKFRIAVDPSDSSPDAEFISLTVVDGECSGVVVVFLDASKTFNGHLSLSGKDNDDNDNQKGDDATTTSTVDTDININLKKKEDKNSAYLVNRLTAIIFNTVTGFTSNLYNTPSHPRTIHTARIVPLLTTCYADLPTLLRQFKLVVDTEMNNKKAATSTSTSTSTTAALATTTATATATATATTTKKTFQILFKSRFNTNLPKRVDLIPQLADLVDEDKFKVDLGGSAEFTIIVEVVKSLAGVGIIQGSPKGAHLKYSKLNYGECVTNRAIHDSPPQPKVDDDK